MKKTILVVTTFLLFVGLSFGQTPQTPEKTKPVTKTEAKCDHKAEAKTGCEKTCSAKKTSCCDKKGDAKVEVKKEENTPIK